MTGPVGSAGTYVGTYGTVTATTPGLPLAAQISQDFVTVAMGMIRTVGRNGMFMQPQCWRVVTVVTVVNPFAQILQTSM